MAEDVVKSELAKMALHLAKRKADVVPLMQRMTEEWSERAAIREYLGGLPRWRAEREAVHDAGEALGVKFK